MLDISPPNLLREIEAAEKLRDKHLRNILALVKRYIGNWYRDDRKTKPTPENMIFSYIATMLPKLVFNNPGVTVSARRSITDAPVARAMEAGMNAWIKEIDLRNELEAACLDMLLGFGVMKAGIETRSDFSALDGRRDANGVYERFTMEALTPYLFRVDPGDFFLDSQAKSLEQARFIGHKFSRDLEDLQNDPRYDPDVVGKLTAEGTDAARGGVKPLFTGKPADIDRKRVTIHELYLPEYRQICAICTNAAGEGQYIRPPAEYIGPPDGPYVMLGVYGVPGSPYPLSPLAAMADQAEELNAHATAAAREAAAHKRLLVVDNKQPGVTEAVQQAETGNVVGVPNFNQQAAMNVELGGTSPQRMAYIESLRDRLDRVIGFSDAQRGRAADVTATEASIVNNAADDRTSFIQLKFRDGVKDALTRAAWFLFNNEAVVMAVSMQDQQTGQETEGLFMGGIQEGQEFQDWYDYQLDLEPYSMRRIDGAARQAQSQQLLQLALLIAPAMIQYPFINWRAILEDLGEAAEMPDYAQKILNAQGMMMLGMSVGGSQLGVGGGPMPQLPPGMGMNSGPLAVGGGQGAVNPPGRFAPHAALPASTGPAPASLPG